MPTAEMKEPAGPVFGAAASENSAPPDSPVTTPPANQADEFSVVYTPAQDGKGGFNLCVTTPPSWETITKTQAEEISVTFVTGKGPTFTCTLDWGTAKAQTKGAFAISGKSAT